MSIKTSPTLKSLERAMRNRAECFDNADDFKYPPLQHILDVRYAPGLPDHSFARTLRFRPDRYIVRTYSPSGLTPNGLLVTKNEKWPRIWAHVLACSTNNPLALYPGCLVVFKRHCEDYLGYDRPQRLEYPGEKLPVEILSYKAIVAIIEEAPVTVRF